MTTQNQINSSDLPLTGGTMSGNIAMGTNSITGLANPVNAQDAATKTYVDTIATGGAALVVCATTANLTATQVGAGVGATLTNSGAQAAFSVDGVTPAAGSRVLVKNQSASANNGIYLLTVAGTGATNWVLTRAIDYDTPSDINDTGIIPVQSGTVNGGTGWVNTTINVTVDTTAITYVQFINNSAINPLSFNGRITLSSGVPVTTTDVTAATKVYFTPYKGNQLSIYNGTNWTTITFSETSINVPATTATMYDLFAQNSSGTLALVAVAWTNDTTRATGLSLQNGVYCETGTLTNLYLGSFRTTGTSGQTQDAIAGRYVWNYFNRIKRTMNYSISTASWTYTTASYRQADANTAAQLDFIIGMAEDSVWAQLTAVNQGSATSSVAQNGIGINSTSSNSATISCNTQPAVANVARYINVATLDYVPAVGRTYLPWLEYGSTTSTFYGGTGSNGLVGYVFA